METYRQRETAAEENHRKATKTEHLQTSERPRGKMRDKGPHGKKTGGQEKKLKA